jgi:conjugal transfer/entry exclusion protein
MDRKLIRFFLLLLPIILIAVMGCATAPKPVVTEVPPPTQQGLGELRDLLLQGKAEIQATSNAARELTQKTGEVSVSSINQLNGEINRLETVRAKTWGVHQDVQAKAKDYFAEWERQLQTMTGKVAEEGGKRRAASMASFEILKVKGQQLGEVYNPFVAKLLESTRYLDTDRTSEGLKVVAPQINEQLSLEGELMNRINALVAQIDTMKGGR